MNTLIDSIIEESNGKFMTITFRKNNGHLRTINGRIGVFYEGMAADHRYDSLEQRQAYFLIWSVKERGYRRINANNVISIRSQGTEVVLRKAA